MVINLISDLSVTTKDGDLSNTRAESFTRGAAIGGTATSKQESVTGMKQETQSEIQAAITETWVRDKINPSGQGVEEDGGTIDPSLEDSLGDGTSMEVGRIPKTSVEEKVPACSQMEDFMVASTSRQGSVTEGSLVRGGLRCLLSRQKDAIVLHVEDSGIFQLSMDQAGQSQRDEESRLSLLEQDSSLFKGKETKRPGEKRFDPHLYTENEDQNEAETDNPSQDVVIIPNQVLVIIRHEDRLTRVS